MDFNNGKLNGVSKEYHKNRNVKHLDTYKDGQLVDRKVYDETGKLESGKN